MGRKGVGVMHARDKRKQPCADCKRTQAQSWWCHGCGSWERVNGKAVRPAVGFDGACY